MKWKMKQLTLKNLKEAYVIVLTKEKKRKKG